MPVACEEVKAKAKLDKAVGLWWREVVIIREPMPPPVVESSQDSMLATPSSCWSSDGVSP